MSLVNRVQLICNLGQEPKIIKSEHGIEFVTISAATNESYRQNEEWKTHTEWHNIIVFGKLAEIAKWLKKGEQVFVEGKLRSNKWVGQDGIEQSRINIVASKIYSLKFDKSSMESNVKIKKDVGEECLSQLYEILSKS